MLAVAMDWTPFPPPPTTVQYSCAWGAGISNKPRTKPEHSQRHADGYGPLWIGGGGARGGGGGRLSSSLSSTTTRDLTSGPVLDASRVVL